MNKDNAFINIILTDDDEDDRFFFREILADHLSFVRLSEMENGVSLLEYLNRIDSGSIPDLIFLDINMPGKTGIECLAEIRSKTEFRDTVIIMFTTSSNESDINASFDNGANLYIRKPNSLNQGSQLIKSVIDMYRNDRKISVPRSRFVI